MTDSQVIRTYLVEEQLKELRRQASNHQQVKLLKNQFLQNQATKERRWSIKIFSNIEFSLIVRQHNHI